MSDSPNNGAGNDIIHDDPSPDVPPVPVAPVIVKPHWIRYLDKHGYYYGRTPHEAWQVFCMIFGGLNQFMDMEPDLQLLTAEQLARLEAELAE